jgi:hypothetical protein
MATMPEQGQRLPDVEFITAGKKEYALAGTLRKGLRIIDVTNPARPRQAAHYDCPLYQGDVQVWQKGGRAYAAYTADSAFDSGGVKASTSQCGRDLADDFAAQGVDPARALGTVIVDISNPRKPRTVSFLSVPRGSHNMTIHPSGDYLYNSNSDLATSTDPTIEVWDVSEVKSPTKVHTLHLPVVPTSLGSESHDITFDADGDRAYSAAISQTLVLDTTNPAAHRIRSRPATTTGTRSATPDSSWAHLRWPVRSLNWRRRFWSRPDVRYHAGCIRTGRTAGTRKDRCTGGMEPLLMCC